MLYVLKLYRNGTVLYAFFCSELLSCNHLRFMHVDTRRSAPAPCPAAYEPAVQEHCRSAVRSPGGRCLGYFQHSVTVNDTVKCTCAFVSQGRTYQGAAFLIRRFGRVLKRVEFESLIYPRVSHRVVRWHDQWGGVLPSDANNDWSVHIFKKFWRID